MIIKPILRFLAPYSCIVCAREGQMLCETCRDTQIIKKAPTCFSCNALSKNFATCAPCYSKRRIARVFVAARYEGVLKELILRMKYERGADIAISLGELIADNLGKSSAQIIVPVPSVAARRRARGFNPAEEIAKTVARRLDLPLLDALGRLGIASQVGRSRRTRLTQTPDTMYVKSHANLLKDARVLLIDDVVTTGATLSEAARALRAAGARSISAALVARR